MNDYDTWKLDTPEYEDHDDTGKLDFTVSGDIETLKKFEVMLLKLANDLELDVEY